MSEESLMEKIVSLCKRRGFVFPGSEIYGGLANSWDYGPLGVELKNNIKQLWWERFVRRRDDIVGIDAALIMNPQVWRNSGHLDNFHDLMSECKNCNKRVRIDEYLSESEMLNFNTRFKELVAKGNASENLDQANQIFEETRKTLNEKIDCPKCGKKDWSEVHAFDLMFKTFIGATNDGGQIVYLRPETAQAMFVDFKNVVDTTRKKLPFGIAQIGKAFRNEITPGNFIFRTREFEQMEIEYFIREVDWETSFEAWRKEMQSWMEDIGLEAALVHQLEVPDGERAHYSKRTIDFEYEFPFGKKELYGLAYRTDFDLHNHFKEAPYKDAETGEELWPHVIEPTWGVDRSMLAILCAGYKEEEKDGEKRVYLQLKPRLAPYKAAVFPLLKNKPELVAKAKEIYDMLRKDYMVAWDDRGNVGKRYYSQDEIGTPYCITVDFDTIGQGESSELKGTVTVRDRDTTEQKRMKIEELSDFIRGQINH